MPSFTLAGVQLTTDVDADTFLAKEAITAGQAVSIDTDQEASVADATDSA